VAKDLNAFNRTKKVISFDFAKKIKRMIIKRQIHKQEILDFHGLISSQIAKCVMKEFKNEKIMMDMKKGSNLKNDRICGEG
jgi:hypothetical protein